MDQPEVRTIQVVEAEIHTLELRISQLRSERNTFLPIHKIPPEVFSHIFCLSAFSRNPKTEGDHRATVTSVSRYWRAVAIGCPILWSLIDGANPQWVGLCLERSRDSPLEIDNYNADFNKPWPMSLSPCIPRARSLQIKGFFPSAGTSSGVEESGWARPAPQLRTLDIRTSKLPQWLFAKSAPLLQKLTLQSSQQDWDVISSSFRGLTALKIAQPDEQITLYDLLVGLAGMPCLADLELDRVIAPATQTPQFPSQGTDRPPQLKALHLVIGDPESAIPVYAHLLHGLEHRISDKTRIDVKIYEGKIESQLFDLSKVIHNRWWDSPRGITEIHIQQIYSNGFTCQFRINQLDLSPAPSPDDPPVVSLVINFSLVSSRNRWMRAIIKEMKDNLNHLRKLYITHLHEMWSDNVLALFGQLPNLEDLTIPCRNSFAVLDYPETEGATTPETHLSSYPFPVLKKLTLTDCEWLLPENLHDFRHLLKRRKRAGIGMEKLVLIGASRFAIAAVKDLVDELVIKDRW